MTHASESVGAVCERVDHAEFAGNIVEEIKKMISESVAVIADISEGKSNVLYEVGFAHALGKPTVHVSWTPLKDLPFDVSQWTQFHTRKDRLTSCAGHWQSVSRQFCVSCSKGPVNECPNTVPSDPARL